jgi:hypothetical protein
MCCLHLAIPEKQQTTIKPIAKIISHNFNVNNSLSISKANVNEMLGATIYRIEAAHGTTSAN